MELLGKSTSDGRSGRNDPGDIIPGRMLENKVSNLQRGKGNSKGSVPCEKNAHIM